jgi:hypothetical protein
VSGINHSSLACSSKQSCVTVGSENLFSRLLVPSQPVPFVSGSSRRVHHRARGIVRLGYRARRHRLPGRCGNRPCTLGIGAAFAQDTDRANTYQLLTLFGDVFVRAAVGRDHGVVGLHPLATCPT